MKAKRKHYTEHQKRRFVSAIKARLKGRSVQHALRLVSDLEDISVKGLEHIWYTWQKAERLQAEPEKTAADFGVVYPLAGSEKVELSVAHFPLEPVVPPPEPEIPYLRTEGELSCSRCKSKDVVYQKPGLYFCQVCKASLPWEDQGDYELKYHESPYRKAHWMA
jgi:hypothetical protein